MQVELQAFCEEEGNFLQTRKKEGADNVQSYLCFTRRLLVSRGYAHNKRQSRKGRSFASGKKGYAVFCRACELEKAT